MRNMATAHIQSRLMEQIKSDLSCSICLELFNKPKVLPCKHTFCQNCLQDWIGGNVPFQCPNCTLKVTLSHKEVTGLPNNQLVAKLCERMKLLSASSVRTRSQTKSRHRCQNHPSQQLKCYCMPCKVSICSKCLEELHRGHVTKALTNAYEERRFAFQDVITRSRSMLEVRCSMTGRLKETEKQLNDQKQQVENSIIQRYDQMVQVLTESKDTLLFDVDNIHRQNMVGLQEQREGLLVESCDFLSAFHSATQNLGMGYFEQHNELVHVVSKYSSKPAPPPVQTQTAVFQPTSSTDLTLGHVTVESSPLFISNPNSDEDVVSDHPPNLQMQSEPQQKRRLTFGRRGVEQGEFDKPYGVAVSDECEIFVADRGNKRIQVLTMQGTFIHKFRTIVKGKETMDPYDVALDMDGNLWVVGNTDSAHFAVQYTRHGQMLRKFDLQHTGRGRGIAVETRRNYVLITETTGEVEDPQGVVLVFRPDGTLVRTVGGFPWLSFLWQQEILYPRYVTVGREGNIFVSDKWNHCVYTYDEEGTFLFKFGCWGNGEGQLSYPRGLCTSSLGTIIVADTWNNRVVLFDKAGRFLKSIGHEKPRAVAMTPQGQLVVTGGDHSITILPATDITQ